MEDCIYSVIAAGVVRISFTDTADVPDQVIAPHDGDSPAVAFLGTVEIDECGCGHATKSIGAKTSGVYWALGQRRTAPRGVRTGRGDVVRRDGMLIEPSYKGFRIEVNAVAEGERFNAEVRIRQHAVQAKPHFGHVSCFKLTADTQSGPACCGRGGGSIYTTAKLDITRR
jgi:hypothetical protein